MPQITRTGPFEGPDHPPELPKAARHKTLTVRVFDVTEFYDRYPEFLADLAPAFAAQEPHHSAHVVEGLGPSRRVPGDVHGPRSGQDDREDRPALPPTTRAATARSSALGDFPLIREHPLTGGPATTSRYRH